MLESSGREPLSEERYRFAAEFVTPGDVVIDAACGSGYGRSLLPDCGYWGVDYHDGPEVDQVADLMSWVPEFKFDVWIGLETIEHLVELDHYVEQAKKARKWIVISTPIVPTTHYNPWHVRDHSAEEVVAMFTDVSWSLAEGKLIYQFDDAGFEYGLFAFKRRGK